MQKVVVHSIAPWIALADFLCGRQPWFTETYHTWLYLGLCCILYALTNMIGTVGHFTYDRAPVYHFWDWITYPAMSVLIAIMYVLFMQCVGWLQVIYANCRSKETAVTSTTTTTTTVEVSVKQKTVTTVGAAEAEV